MAMAQRSRSSLMALMAIAVLAGTALWALAPAAFVPSQAALHRAEPGALAAAAVALPTAVHAAPLAGAVDAPPEVLEAGSSLSLAGLTEVLMCGIVMGVVPTTILGLLVAAWLQFKKGPTLGL
mmetsp:Transcript_4113/g.12031  ORF Transcript_4113/g.12031 Transcript_4113/m.12031 type:complete len:123 (-) Transcript_4113:66-434(-)